MKKVEVVDTGRLLARMIQKYGDAILAELGAETGQENRGYDGDAGAY